jgi:hypothetical protein
MFKQNTQKSNWPIILVCMTFIMMSVGCATQSQDIKTADNTNQPVTGDISPCLSSREAMNSVGKTACVEFYIGNASQYKDDVFLNEMADYTKGFGATILADSAAKFEDPFGKFRFKTIRVTGQIIVYDGHPGIIISNPADISIVK